MNTDEIFNTNDSIFTFYDLFEDNFSSIKGCRLYTYNDILDTVKALKEVRESGLTNMFSLKNVISVLQGMGYNKEADIIASIKERRKFSSRYYFLLLDMIDNN